MWDKFLNFKPIHLVLIVALVPGHVYASATTGAAINEITIESETDLRTLLGTVDFGPFYPLNALEKNYNRIRDYAKRGGKLPKDLQPKLKKMRNYLLVRKKLEKCFPQYGPESAEKKMVENILKEAGNAPEKIFADCTLSSDDFEKIEEMAKDVSLSLNIQNMRKLHESLYFTAIKNTTREFMKLNSQFSDILPRHYPSQHFCTSGGCGGKKFKGKSATSWMRTLEKDYEKEFNKLPKKKVADVTRDLKSKVSAFNSQVKKYGNDDLGYSNYIADYMTLLGGNGSLLLTDDVASSVGRPVAKETFLEDRKEATLKSEKIKPYLVTKGVRGLSQKLKSFGVELNKKAGRNVESYDEDELKDNLYFMLEGNPKGVAEVLLTQPELTGATCGLISAYIEQKKKDKETQEWIDLGLTIGLIGVSVLGGGIGLVAWAIRGATAAVRVGRVASVALAAGTYGGVAEGGYYAYKANEAGRERRIHESWLLAGGGNHDNINKMVDAIERQNEAASDAAIAIGFSVVDFIGLNKVVRALKITDKLAGTKSVTQSLEIISQNQNLRRIFSGFDKLTREKAAKFVGLLSGVTEVARVALLMKLQHMAPEKVKQVIEEALVAAKKAGCEV